VKFNEYLMLQLTGRFELSVPKGRFSCALQASAGSSESFNVIFF
jgi:hypothetical protein